MSKQIKNMDVKELYRPRRKLYKSVSRLEKYERAYNECLSKQNFIKKSQKSPQKKSRKRPSLLSKYRSPSKPFKKKLTRSPSKYKSPKNVKKNRKIYRGSPKKNTRKSRVRWNMRINQIN